MMCLIQCVECGDRHLLAFSSPRARGLWANEHGRKTGHDRWNHCIDAPKSPADGLLFLIAGSDDLEEVAGRREVDLLWDAWEEILRWQVAHNDALRELIQATMRRVP